MEAVEAVWLPLADRKESVDVYVTALETAQEALSGWEKDGFDLTAQAYLDLKEAVRDCAFGQVDMTDNLRMRDAAESLSGYVQKLREEALTVDGVTVSGRPVSVEHYDLSGRRIKPGCRGVTVVRELYRDGSVRVQKRLNVFSSL